MFKKDLPEVHFLRGLASLMVCLFHIILGNEVLFPSTNLLEQVFSVGYLGVEIFFILSGYVICYSLPENFGYQHLKTFLLKRVVRIEPPYVVSILLVLLLNYVSHRITGLPHNIDVVVILSHLAYINNFVSGSYVNVVYWTLGIEFQFYLIIGLLFPFFQRSYLVLIAMAFAFISIACLPLPFKADVILPYFSFFVLGILLFFFKTKTQLALLPYLLISALCCLQIYLFQGVAATVAATSTLLTLHFWNYSHPLIRFFSTISYSLYLVHVPVGGKIINLGMRFAESGAARYGLVLLAIGSSIGFAYLFYRCVEAPAISFSKRITYKILVTDTAPLPRRRYFLAKLKTKDTPIT